MNNLKTSWHHKLDAVATAFVFIAIGIPLIARNIGIIDYSVFNFLVSWKMLLIVIGIVQLMKQKLVAGAILLTIGFYFIVPAFPWWPGRAIITFWPVVFIGTGLITLFGKKNNNPFRKKWKKGESKSISQSEDGFVTAEVTFGSTHQIVLFDPVFKGAYLCASFAKVTLDLRKTRLEQPETIIEVECSFGGIELLVPSDWNVIIEAESAFSGYQDKRYKEHDVPDAEHKLIIRGELAFSGLEIKD
ncbi:MAG: cell wall-active antibiotics response protein [Tannerellaceae bacterium]|nr:cell wall-active antibiotics response protein [Tannerellaceae bacterium]